MTTFKIFLFFLGLGSFAGGLNTTDTANPPPVYQSVEAVEVNKSNDGTVKVSKCTSWPMCTSD